MKLSTKLILSFLSIILFSILLTGYISHNKIYEEFKFYLIEEHDNKLNNLSNRINEYYEEEDYILKSSYIDSLASSESVVISIYDLDEILIYQSQRNRTGHGRMSGHGKHMNTNGDYVEKSFPLLKNNIKTGQITIGFYDRSYLTQNAIIFNRTLNKSFLVSGFISLIISLIIAIFLSRNISIPLTQLTQHTKSLESGQFKIQPIKKNNTIEINELANSIKYLAKSLEEEEFIRNKYAQDISHELRTPITTIKGYMETIIDGVWEAEPDKLNIVLEEVDRLSVLVEQLRKSFLLETSDTINTPENLNLKEEINNIVNIYRPIFAKENANVSINCKENIYLNINKEDFYQITTNIISNSIKYLPTSDAKLDITIEKSRGSIYLVFQDNGIGIAEKDIPFLFNRFYRVDSSRNNSTGGSGLGLSIVDNLVKKNNGEIFIESKINLGTKVTIKLG